MNDLNVLDLKPFVPTKDYAVARRFHADLGFKKNWRARKLRSGVLWHIADLRT